MTSLLPYKLKLVHEDSVPLTYTANGRNEDLCADLASVCEKIWPGWNFTPLEQYKWGIFNDNLARLLLLNATVDEEDSMRAITACAVMHRSWLQCLRVYVYHMHFTFNEEFPAMLTMLARENPDAIKAYMQFKEWLDQAITDYESKGVHTIKLFAADGAIQDLKEKIK